MNAATASILALAILGAGIAVSPPAPAASTTPGSRPGTVSPKTCTRCIAT